jgi:hypothetical protein
MIIFYNKMDSNKEPIGKTSDYNNRLDATKHFAQLKQLAIKDFVRIFKVEKINV